jgi:hypothetical protein
VSWVFLIAGVVAIAAGTWIALNPDKAAQFVGTSQRRGGIGSWGTPEDLTQTKNELGLPVGPGYRAKAMRAVGVLAIVVGIGFAVAAITGVAK